MTDKLTAEFYQAVFDTDREQALKVVHGARARGMSPEDIVFKCVIPAIERMITAISENFEANLAQHFMTSQIAAEVTAEMTALFTRSPVAAGRVIIGTAYGDMHTLGKRIVIGCLKALMIDVLDLGVSVPAQRFVDEAVARDAQVIAISAMMVHTARGAHGCLEVRRLLQEKGLGGKIRIVVGGAPFRFDHELYKTVGADAWAADGITGGKVIAGFVQEVRT